MPWKFDAQAVDIIFVIDTTSQIVSGSIEFGDDLTSDLALDTGDRDNDTSIVDSGLRIIDGDI
jgi:hypothetical protein